MQVTTIVINTRNDIWTIAEFLLTKPLITSFFVVRPRRFALHSSHQPVEVHQSWRGWDFSTCAAYDASLHQGLQLAPVRKADSLSPSGHQELLGKLLGKSDLPSLLDVTYRSLTARFMG